MYLFYESYQIFTRRRGRRTRRRNFPICGKAEVIDSFGAAVQKAQILDAKTSNDVSTLMSADKQFNAFLLTGKLQSNFCSKKQIPFCIPQASRFCTRAKLLNLIILFERKVIDTEWNWTWPDTRKSSCERLGRSSNAKTTHNFRNICYGRTDRPTDTARCRVACPPLKSVGVPDILSKS